MDGSTSFDDFLSELTPIPLLHFQDQDLTGVSTHNTLTLAFLGDFVGNKMIVTNVNSNQKQTRWITGITTEGVYTVHKDWSETPFTVVVASDGSMTGHRVTVTLELRS